MSRTFRLNACARGAHSASPASSAPYSFRVEPQVAQSVTMTSRSCRSKRAMLWRAWASTRSTRP